jgi:sugar-phosphatase
MFAERTFSAFLFDMDGTLVDSIAVTSRIWARWAEGHGIEPDAVLRTMHGVRAVETIRRHLPQGDIEREVAVLTQAEMEDMGGVVELAGAAAFLRSLPPRRWSVVTSAPRALALARLERAGIPVPPVLVTAEDVTRGKPAPDCFLLAARKLGVEPGDCLVWEDAPSGIAAAEAAGATVVVVTATHAHPMATSHPMVASYEGLAAGLDAAGRLTLAVPGSRAACPASS